MKRTILVTMLCLALTASAGFAADTQSQDMAKDAQSQQQDTYYTTKTKGQIEYVSGGVGKQERDTMQGMQNKYDLKLTFAQQDGNYLGDVNVTIRSAQGEQILQDTVQGPWLLVKLPKGDYVVESTYEGRTAKRQVSVQQNLQVLHFTWAQPAAAGSGSGSQSASQKRSDEMTRQKKSDSMSQ
jgi:hypothetical protein